MAVSITADDARIVSWEMYSRDMTRAAQRLLDLCSRIESLAMSQMMDDEFDLKWRQKCAKDLMNLSYAFVCTLPDEVFNTLEEHRKLKYTKMSPISYRSGPYTKFTDECLRFIKPRYPSFEEELTWRNFLLSYVWVPGEHNLRSLVTSPVTEMFDAICAL